LRIIDPLGGEINTFGSLLSSIIITSMSNHLVQENSPYLLQHAHNPVDWYPWSRLALEKAQREDKPIFLSIGYAACHWCHVMSHESFEDPSIAKVLNSSFISIKVDREERPDLDSIYMNFVVATTGSGGWPLNVFLTPKGKPFYGGTYYPLYRSHNLPSFREVLDMVVRLWRTDRAAILQSSENLTRSLQSQPAAGAGEVALDPAILDQAVQAISRSYDWHNGGWGGAPKFPQPMQIEFLLRQATRNNQASLAMAQHVLHAMAQGGMYDVLGGGFARYSVDPAWLIPHFEKMLYDNAQLARVYLHAYQLTGELFFREVCEATLDFILRELSHPAGGFYTSLDADSDGKEGMYYLWTMKQVRSAFADPQDAELFIAAYAVSQEGNFYGQNILRRTQTDEQLTQQFHLDVNVIKSRLAGLRCRLLELRSRRPRPATDDKVLVAWNALALAAFAEAGRVLGRRDYSEAAIRNANFILENMQESGRLFRSWREGRVSHPAYLEDYAGLGLALLAIYQADPRPSWYQVAIQLLDQVLAQFSDPSGGFFDTPDDHQDLIYRPKEVQDNVLPSGTAQALTLLTELAAYEGRSDWRSLAEATLTSHLRQVLRYPSAFAQWLCAADIILGPVHQVAVVGELVDPATQNLLEPLWQSYQPRTIIASSGYPPTAGSPALLNDRPLLNDKPTAYVCQGFVCRQPVNGPDAMLEQLRD
jgi:uncharacterized protein YyaL (SSP411 family)